VTLDTCRVFGADRLPADLAAYAALVVMGGPMSATSDEGFPTRRAEVALLQYALERELPTLGVCLGAQLLALAAGAAVYTGQAGQEIGWAPVALTDQAPADPLFGSLFDALPGGPPAGLTVLHWHGDTFDLPPGAAHLASSAMYPNQAFRTGPAAWGLQFHLEVDAAAIEAFVNDFGDQATACGTEPCAIRAAAPEALAQLEPVRRRVLGRFAELVRDRQVLPAAQSATSACDSANPPR